jgi:crotonobetainyl-CoA:carnitine CoA-transferase CaiB-like acyl-CoA transferase
MELFWQLVDRADVLLQNFRPGVAEKLGIDYEAVRQRRREIVYVTIDTYGPGGPWSGRRGWDPTAAASSGMQTRYGGDGAPAVQAFALNDYGTGIMAAFGASLALRHRHRTGEGQHVRAALVLTAGMLQSRFLFDFAGRNWDELAGQDAVGEAPLQRLYRTSDSWLFLGASEDDMGRLVEVPGLNGIANVSEHDLEKWLEARFAEESAATWQVRLDEAGIAAAESVDFRAAMDARWAADRGLSITRQHDGGRVTTTGPAPVLARTPVRPGRAAPPPGSDAASVLADVGREEDLDELLRLGALALEARA